MEDRHVLPESEQHARLVPPTTHIAAGRGDLDGSSVLWQEHYQLRTILES